MSTEQKFKYEVAFSFLQNDEPIAYEINDLIQDRFSTFIYSKAQEELAGTDGAEQFSEIFYALSRIVVVLFNDDWGKTRWTRIEESAIKNRMLNEGWDFLFVVKLNTKSRLPHWIPETHIWFDYPRFKAEGVIGVIDQRIRKVGGKSRPESIEDQVARLKRKRGSIQERDSFLQSIESLQTHASELRFLMDEFQNQEVILEDQSTGLIFCSKSRPDPPMFQLEYNEYCLCFVSDFYINMPLRQSMDRTLRITLYSCSGHINRGTYKEKIQERANYRFDQDLNKNNGWSELENRDNFLTSKQLLGKWMNKFINGISQMNN